MSVAHYEGTITVLFFSNCWFFYPTLDFWVGRAEGYYFQLLRPYFLFFSFQSYFLIFCFQQINLQRMYDRAEIDLLFIALQSNRLANS